MFSADGPWPCHEDLPFLLLFWDSPKRKKKKNFGLNFDKQQKRLPIFDVTFYFLFRILNLRLFYTLSFYYNY
jgi:hypothetical protein